MQQLNMGAFDKAKFDQSAFQFGARQAGSGLLHGKRLDAAAKAHARIA